MEYLKVKNWEKWQSYRSDRGQPPWIKIHRELLRKVKWISLDDRQRGHLLSLWLLAADNNGTIPYDPKIVKKLCQMSSLPDLNLFIEQDFLVKSDNQGKCHVDANMTPPRRHHDVPDKSRVDKSRVETEETPSSKLDEPPDSTSLKPQRLVNIFKECAAAAGASYTPIWARDCKLMKDLIAGGVAEEDVLAAAKAYWHKEHKFKGNKDIPSFFKGFNRLKNQEIVKDWKDML